MQLSSFDHPPYSVSTLPLLKRKYQQLYSSHDGPKPGPSGPSKEIISAIVEMKQLCIRGPVMAEELGLLDARSFLPETN
ncbi:MAG: hypothetical protein AB8C02_03765 [Halioglobus sp.]